MANKDLALQGLKLNHCEVFKPVCNAGLMRTKGSNRRKTLPTDVTSEVAIIIKERIEHQGKLKKKNMSWYVGMILIPHSYPSVTLIICAVMKANNKQHRSIESFFSHSQQVQHCLEHGMAFRVGRESGTNA